MIETELYEGTYYWNLFHSTNQKQDFIIALKRKWKKGCESFINNNTARWQQFEILQKDRKTTINF